MANTNFVDEETTIEAAWLNQINDFYFDLCGEATTSDQVAENINAAQTASSTGGDEDVYKQKTGTDLEFKGITGGAGIVVSSDANAVTITAMLKAMDKSFWPTLTWVDADNITFSAGTMLDSDGDTVIDLTAGVTRDTSAVFDDGANTNGQFDGASFGQTVHCFVIMKADGTVNCGFDSDVDCANIPSAYDYIYYRRVGSLYYTGGDIQDFTQYGNKFLYNVAPTTYQTGSPSSTAVQTDTLSLPAVEGLTAICSIRGSTTSTTVTSFSAWFASTDQNLGLPSLDNQMLQVAQRYDSEPSVISSIEALIPIDASAQIHFRLDSALATCSVAIKPRGWIDERIV